MISLTPDILLTTHSTCSPHLYPTWALEQQLVSEPEPELHLPLSTHTRTTHLAGNTLTTHTLLSRPWRCPTLATTLLAVEVVTLHTLQREATVPLLL
jgi:hypothetical protein